jgi:transcriptional regulator with XRE-family HTH domain
MSFAGTGRVSSLEAFGPNLRRKRMRSGLSLEDLSARTKVSVELWDAMERNDFSRWPAGVAARSYIRSYAEAVGADPTATVDEFCRVVPNGDRRAERLVRGTAEVIGHQLVWSDDLPPALAEGDRRAADASRASTGIGWWLEAHPRRLAAGADLAVVTLVAWLTATLAKIDLWMTLASVALLYNAVSVAFLGCSPSVWAVDTYRSTRPAAVVGRPPDKAFRRLGGLMRNGDPAPERDTAS